MTTLLTTTSGARRLVRPGLAILALIALSGAGGCANNAQRGAATGALLGGAAGAIIGHQSGETGAGAAIGAAVGGGLGYVIGNEEDKKYNGYGYNPRSYRSGYGDPGDYHDPDYYRDPGYHAPRYDGCPY